MQISHMKLTVPKLWCSGVLCAEKIGIEYLLNYIMFANLNAWLGQLINSGNPHFCECWEFSEWYKSLRVHCQLANHNLSEIITIVPQPYYFLELVTLRIL